MNYKTELNSQANIGFTQSQTTNSKRIVLTTFGSLGDLYPYLAIAQGLKKTRSFTLDRH
ncbi:hypothetical protein [Okeania sp. KiyG1]|uniref:hypothetical protein n=1 Tax=Okeania sp. KiyG1 TaxID=2720165 RepID=UPI001922531C|nr:hypothetical protein [Okeania sp. KiyG1]